MQLRYGLYDADNHYYEPPDCYTRHIEPKFRDRAIHVEQDDEGRDVVLVGDRPFTFLDHYSFERVARPGALREMLRTMKSEGLARARTTPRNRSARSTSTNSHGSR